MKGSLEEKVTDKEKWNGGKLWRKSNKKSKMKNKERESEEKFTDKKWNEVKAKKEKK